MVNRKARGAELNFSQFIDLLLARLYESERQEGAGKFFDLRIIAKGMKSAIPDQWVFDAGKVLEAQGLAQCIFTMGGNVQAMLTGEGRLFVENNRGTGIIEKYWSAPGNYVVVTGSGHQVVVGKQRDVKQQMSIVEERRPAFNLLEEIEKELRSDSSLSQSERQDLLADLDMIRRQLNKKEPNRAALAALLEPLSQISSIAGAVVNLIRLLNP
jgi:hypothetical protein